VGEGIVTSIGSSTSHKEVLANPDRISQAEEKRAMAVALEQTMKAKSEEARSQVILAEAEVPKALALALKNGNLGLMDYYRMQNLKADTQMRASVAIEHHHTSET
jgi:uncharacterized protein YqfA (UPF0365 family)